MKLVKSLEQAFTSAKNPLIASGQESYMKNRFPFLGIPKPLRAQLQKECFRPAHISSGDELHEIALQLWNKTEREYHYAACDLIIKHKKLLNVSFLLKLEHMICTHSWWDTVDAISSNLLGVLLLQESDLVGHMDSWIVDPYMWKRRAALIYQLKYKDKTDKERLFLYCEQTMNEKEFFIRKAIGWALREYSKTDPQGVRGFINTHINQLSALTNREASKYC